MLTFVEWLNEQDRAEKTITGYQADLARFAAWFKSVNEKDLTPVLLTNSDIRQYRNHLQDDQAKPATINRQLATIRAYTKWALDTEQITNDPARNIRPAKAQKLAPKWLTKPERASVIATAERAINAAKTPSARLFALRDKTVIIVLLATGLRIGEMCALELGDIEIKDRKGSVNVRQGKGERQRKVPLNNDGRKALLEWLELRGDEPGLLLSGKRGAGITESGLHRRLAEIGRVAKVDLHAHTLRHTFAKDLVDSGVTLEKVAALMGHSSIDTTRIYTTPSEKDLQDAVNKIDS